MKKSLKTTPVWIFILGTIAALIPQYFIRGSHNAYQFMYNTFKTYPGDLWYCWDHYLAQGFPYPREYPVGLQIIYRFIFKVKPAWVTYEHYMIFISLFLGIFAAITTYYLYQIIVRTHKNTQKLIMFWFLAPTFLFYGLLNLDFLPVFTIVAAYLLFVEKKYYLSAAMLGLGTSLKVFPCFLAPLLFFSAPRQYRLGLVISFAVAWLAFNLPFMITDFSSWYYPYDWQIKYNYAKSPQDGSLWWILYVGLNKIGLGSLTGKLSLLLYASLYYWFLKKYWHLPLARKAVGITLLFILTDRIYSPQYNLYYLPFLTLVDYPIGLVYFYLSDILNTSQGFFLFFFKDNCQYLQMLVIVKYFALIMLFIRNLKEPIVMDTDKEYEKNKLPDRDGNACE